MAKYRHHLPQLNGGAFLTDGGLETTLVFHDRQDLPHFAAFDLLRSERGRHLLESYFRRYAAIARSHGRGFVLESATWRASPDWAERLGYTRQTLAHANEQAITMLADLRRELEAPDAPMVISGCVGPRGDGYVAGAVMDVSEAQKYHTEQIRTWVDSDVDVVSAITMTNTPEAIGIVRAAQAFDLPVVISFTVETDGSLPTGQSLCHAIEQVDAATQRGPAYYMINCAHPIHFQHLLGDTAWARRLGGIRANASKRSHAELDAAADLDDGNPAEFGRDYRALQQRLPWLSVLGGCCGTDHRHIEAVAAACAGH